MVSKTSPEWSYRGPDPRTKVKPVPSQLHSLRKSGIDFRMGYLVSHVNEPCFPGPDVRRHCNSLVNGHVGWMMAMTEHVEKQGLDTIEQTQGLRRNARGIRAPGQRQNAPPRRRVQVIKAKSENGQSAMEYSKRRDPQAVELDGLTRFKDMGKKRGDERWICIPFRLEDVWVDTLHMFHASSLRMDWYRLLHDCIEPAYLVKTEEMVDVVVRMEDAVAPGDVLPENLLPEIGRCVDQKYPLHASGIREPGRRACTGSRIARILGAAGCTVASYCRDTGRGAGSEHDELECRLIHGACLSMQPESLMMVRIVVPCSSRVRRTAPNMTGNMKFFSSGVTPM